MDKIFRQVSVKERLPNYGRYFTNHGECAYIPNENTWYFLLKDCTESVEWWLEEVELPTNCEIDWKYPLNANETHKTTLNVGCRTGAKWALNALKGEKR